MLSSTVECAFKPAGHPISGILKLTGVGLHASGGTTVGQVGTGLAFKLALDIGSA